MAKAATGKAAQAAAKPKCLTCKNKAKSRGLCGTCLAACKTCMDEGVSEQWLIEAGLLLPRQKSSGRPANSGFAKALSRKFKK